MKKINPNKVKRAQELKSEGTPVREIQKKLKEEFGTGINFGYISESTKLTSKGQQLVKAMYDFFIRNKQHIKDYNESDIVMFLNVEEVLQ